MSTVATRWSALLKRELVEHRKGAIYAPWFIAGLLYLLVLASAVFHGVIHINGTAINVLTMAQAASAGNPEVLVMAHTGWLFGLFAIFHAVAGVVMFAYALACLFDERKDRSTLFWRSLPVRDAETVAAKAVMLLVLIPLSFLLALAALQLAVALTISVVCLVQGASVWQTVWAPMPLVKMQGWQLASQVYTSLWVLPAFGWCLFCSAYAKQRPFLLAVFVPGAILIAILSLRLNDTLGMVFGRDSVISHVLTALYQRIGSAFSPLTAGATMKNFKQASLSLQTQIDGLLSWQMWVGILIGVAFIAAAAFLRRYREDAAL